MDDPQAQAYAILSEVKESASREGPTGLDVPDTRIDFRTNTHPFEDSIGELCALSGAHVFADFCLLKFCQKSRSAALGREI